MHDREIQIIMTSFASRSADVSTESRWSGTPSSTRASQVPQTRQDDNAYRPAA